MSESERYNEMSDEFEKLRLSLLPEKFDSTGPYPQEIIVRASAYHVLIHAEIESYIEDRVKDVAMKATRSWKEHKQANKTILNLLAFSGQTMEAPPESLNPTQENQKKDWANKIDISKKISNATTVFFTAVENNHGIKQKNLMRLLLPIGIDISSLDPVWIADMDSFSNDRGEVAHKSAIKRRVRQEIDPESIFKKAESLLKGLNSLDNEIEKLLDDLP